MRHSETVLTHQLPVIQEFQRNIIDSLLEQYLIPDGWRFPIFRADGQIAELAPAKKPH